MALKVRRERGRRFQSELALKPLDVPPCVSDRGRMIALPNGFLHQLQGGVRIVGLLCHQPAPPFHGCGEVTCLLSRERERSERGRMRGGKAVALELQPGLEFH